MWTFRVFRFSQPSLRSMFLHERRQRWRRFVPIVKSVQRICKLRAPLYNGELLTTFSHQVTAIFIDESLGFSLVNDNEATELTSGLILDESAKNLGYASEPGLQPEVRPCMVIKNRSLKKLSFRFISGTFHRNSLETNWIRTGEHWSSL